MTKELSIENIKKELIDKISNNEEVLEIFRKHEYSKDEGKCLREYGDSFIKDKTTIYGLCCEIKHYILTQWQSKVNIL